MNPDLATRIAGWLAETENAVVFTGAGISTESGIPDFRSPGGIWSKYRTVYYDEFMASAQARHEYWRQKTEGQPDFAAAAPNGGHDVIAKWEAAGKIRGVITQNIDGLHQVAGNQQVLELHGTARQIQCQDCGARYEVDPLVAEFLESQCVPVCRRCPDGRLKHATISFGQSLPAVAKQSGGRLVIVNRDATPLDSIADAVVHDSIGSTLTAIDQVLDNRRPEAPE